MVHPGSPPDRFNRSFIGLDPSKPSVKSPPVCCIATTDRFSLGVWKQRTRARCLERSNANGRYLLYILSFYRAAHALMVPVPCYLHGCTFLPRRMANHVSFLPTPPPGSSYSWNRKRFAIPALWILACPHYLYVSLFVSHCYSLKGYLGRRRLFRKITVADDPAYSLARKPSI
jgi:hypothetical protein